VLYRGDLDEIFVTDGPAGSLKIFKGIRRGRSKLWISSHNLTASLRPLYHRLYIITGGENRKLAYSLIAIVDTDKG